VANKAVKLIDLISDRDRAVERVPVLQVVLETVSTDDMLTRRQVHGGLAAEGFVAGRALLLVRLLRLFWGLTGRGGRHAILQLHSVV